MKRLLAGSLVLLACGGETVEEKPHNPPPLASASATATAPPPTDRTKEFQKVGADAFVFGYAPLFIEREKRTATTNQRLPLGAFAHASALPTSADAGLPSLDTLLSTAWLELGASGAYTLKLPDMGNRFFSIQLFDAYAEPIGVVSSKGGTKAQQVVITGPSFSGTVPAGATQIKSTTSSIAIIAHTRVNGDADVSKLSALLKQWSLAPLPPTTAPKDLPPPPIGRPQDLKFAGPEVFDELGDILKAEPTPQDVAGMSPDFAKMGIGAGLTPSKTLKQEELAALAQGIKDGQEQIEHAFEKLATRKNGWDLDATFGKRGADPARQAAFAFRGLEWPVASEELVYISRVDDGDRVLSGAHEYVVHFDKGKLPPAKAFFSITMYTDTASLVPGAKRMVLTDQTAKKSADGSLDVIFQADAPAKNESNWLPAPKGKAFIVVLRVYQPDDAASSWEAPAIKRMK